MLTAKKLLIEFNKYYASIAWIFRDLATHFRFRWIIASIVSLSSPTLQAMAFALLTSFFIASAKGTPIQAKYLDLGFLKSNELSTILIVSLLCPGLLLVSGLARYLGEKLLVDLRFHYTRFSINRGVRKIFQHWFGDDAQSAKVRSKLIIIVRSDSISCGRLASLAASAASPLAEFLIFGAFAFYLFPLLTIAIAVVALLTASHFRRIMSRGNHYFFVRERQAADSSLELKKYAAQTSDLEPSENLSKSLFSHKFPHTESWIYSLSQYTLVAPKSILAANTLNSFVFGIIIIVLGGQIADGAYNLNKSLIYLILLRYIMRAFQQFTSRFSSLNIFYSQVVRYKEVLDGKLPLGFQESSVLEEDVDI